MAVGSCLSLFLLFFLFISQNTSLCTNNVVSIAPGELYNDELYENGMLFKRYLPSSFGIRIRCIRTDIASHFKTAESNRQSMVRFAWPCLQGFLYWILLCIWMF
jgi:hypothetical protein